MSCNTTLQTLAQRSRVTAINNEHDGETYNRKPICRSSQTVVLAFSRHACCVVPRRCPASPAKRTTRTAETQKPIPPRLGWAAGMETCKRSRHGIQSGEYEIINRDGINAARAEHEENLATRSTCRVIYRNGWNRSKKLWGLGKSFSRKTTKQPRATVVFSWFVLLSVVWLVRSYFHFSPLFREINRLRHLTSQLG